MTGQLVIKPHFSGRNETNHLSAQIMQKEAMKTNKRLPILLPTLMALLTLSACAPWTPINQNPNRIRSPERLAYESCLQKAAGNESLCKDEKHALLMQQEWEMMTPDR